MPSNTFNVILLYVSDAAIGVFFVIGLATAVEYLARRAISRILVELTPKQIGLAIFGQMAVVLLALIGFKFIVLSGGPGIATKRILSTSNLTQGYSLAAISTGLTLALLGLGRLVRLLIRSAILVRL